MTKQTAIPPTRSKPASRAELERKRKGVLAVGPSGAVYRIRKINLQRHALAGGMPAELKQAATSMVRRGGAANLEAALAKVDPDELDEAMSSTRAYHDSLVLATIVEPKLTADDLGTGELDDDPLLPAVDYDWALDVAFGRADRDGQGRLLWGPEPLDRMSIFQEAHQCDPETCPGCRTVVELFTAAVLE